MSAQVNVAFEADGDGMDEAGRDQGQEEDHGGEDDEVVLRHGSGRTLQMPKSPAGSMATNMSDYHFERPQTQQKAWDAFKQNEFERGSASEQNTELVKKAEIVLKVVTVLITFCAVFAGSVVSKGALFYMAAQVPFAKDRRPLEFCPQFAGISAGTTGLVVQYSREDSIAWMWCLFLAFAAPEVFTLLRSARICIVRLPKLPPMLDMALVFTLETLHTVGVAILFLCALPHLDSIRATMATCAVCLAPAFLKLVKDLNFEKRSSVRHAIVSALDLLSLACQATALFIWPILDKSTNKQVQWALPVGLLLTSLGWWESFVTEDAACKKFTSYLWRIKTSMSDLDTRYMAYLFISLWKIVLFFALFIVLLVGTGTVSKADDLFVHFNDTFDYGGGHFVVEGWGSGDVVASEVKSTTRTNTPLKVLSVQIVCSYAVYIFGKFACKVNIQRIAFAFPLTLSLPFTLSGLFGICRARSDDPCDFFLNSVMPHHLFFECPVPLGQGEFLQGRAGVHGWVVFLWFLSQCWIVSHVWFPKSRRLATTEQMFGTPYYNGLLLDQSVMLNRRSDKGHNSRLKRLPEAEEPTAADEDMVGGSSFKSTEGGPHSLAPDARRDLGPHGGGEANLESGGGSSWSIASSETTKKQQRRKKMSTGKFTYAKLKPEDEVTRIMGCATMWHENSDEMIEMIKSIFRIDEDYSARLLAKNILNLGDDQSDFYEWETHIFFDDAFEVDDSTPQRVVVNQFVRLLVQMIDEQGKKWYGSRNMKVPSPTKVPTPYGGRLIWTLPGSTQIICHLKDKDKIRHKKRWSQCMYMYYFLGFLLADNPELSEDSKEARARNTYLLALDGDVDFQPEAIIKLVDLMKRGDRVGASCGRIHPTGSGYMQWYQMFEYAIGHWLQKSTEHVMGCVLCSPGCFSLFRAKALMDDNVMRTYTTVSTEPRHFVQYDQGEDRWLCTLMLQQGWRVEYSAASDSFTACPEGFKEFYNQRRRWMPSTIANIMDLLTDYKRVINNNYDISIFYIVYQVMMMIGTALGPGSIFLMLCGATSVAFGFSNWESFGINLAPLLIFVLTCLMTKSEVQVMVAQVLSVLYALVMMAVLIGILIQVADDGWLAPTSLSLIVVAGTFILAGFLHPQEFKCLPMGVIYYITIPSMYLFLVIYSVFNLHVVSWGTREVAKKKTAEELEAERVQAEEEAKLQNIKRQAKGGNRCCGLLPTSGYLESLLSGLFHGGTTSTNTTTTTTELKQPLEAIVKKLDLISSALGLDPEPSGGDDKKNPAPGPELGLSVARKSVETKTNGGNLAAVTIQVNPPPPLQEDLRANKRNNRRGNYCLKFDDRSIGETFWLEQEDHVGDGPRKKLRGREDLFWRDLIAKYLKPLEKNKASEEKMASALLELRNQAAFTFLMLNSIWVICLFLLQENKDKLYVQWPLGAKGPVITYSAADHTLFLEYEYLQLEPLGLLFLVFFMLVLVIQLVGMLMHRTTTLGHIVSTTKVWPGFWRLWRRMKGRREFDANDLLARKGVAIIREWQSNYQPFRDEVTTLEEVVEEALNQLTVGTGDNETLRRFSDSHLGQRTGMENLALMRQETISVLKRHKTQYLERKRTMRATGRGGKGISSPTILEEDGDQLEINYDDPGSLRAIAPHLQPPVWRRPEGVAEATMSMF